MVAAGPYTPPTLLQHCQEVARGSTYLAVIFRSGGGGSSLDLRRKGRRGYGEDDGGGEGASEAYALGEVQG